MGRIANQRKLCTSFEVSLKWLEKYRQDARHMKTGWHERLVSKFSCAEFAKPVNCSLSVGTNYWNAAKSNWTGLFNCSGKECSRRYFFTFSVNDEEAQITMKVEYEGKEKHSSLNPVRAQTRGTARRKMKAMAKTTPATVLGRKLLAEKASDPKGRKALDKGNFDGVPSAAALKQMAYEDAKSEEYPNTDMWGDLVKFAESLHVERDIISDGNIIQKEVLKPIFILSYEPFQVAWTTLEMADHLKKMSQVQKPLVAHIDSTGSLVRMPPWEKNKIVYTYNIVVKDKGHPPIPVSEFISNSHTDTEIGRWLGSFKDHLHKLLGSKTFPFKLITVDMSWAMTNAVLAEMVGMSLNNYLTACIQAKESGVVMFVIVCWCYSHFLNDMKRRANKVLPDDAIYNAAKQFFKFVMGALARTSDLDKAHSLWRNSIIIMESKYYTINVKEATENLAGILGVDKSKLSCVESDDAPPDVPITLPEEDKVLSAFRTTYQDSPFYHIFKEQFDDVSQQIVDPPSSDIAKLKRNGLNIPGIADYLLKYILPFYPLWSLYIQSMVLSVRENPLSNMAAELRFKLLKDETWLRKTYHKPNRFVRKNVKDNHERILSYDYPTNFRKYKKRKRKDIEGEENVPEEDLDNPALSIPPSKKRKIISINKPMENGFPSKKRAVEIWNKRSSKRLPGGFFSAKRTVGYAAKFVAKAKEVSTRLDNWHQRQRARKEKQQLKLKDSVENTCQDTNPDNVPENMKDVTINECCPCKKDGPWDTICISCKTPLHKMCGFLRKDGAHQCWICMLRHKDSSPIVGHVTVRKRNTKLKLKPSVIDLTCGNDDFEASPAIVTEEPGGENDGEEALPWDLIALSFPDIHLNYRYNDHSISVFDLLSLREDCLVTETIIDCFLEIMKGQSSNEWADIFILPSQALITTSIGMTAYKSLAESPIILNDIWIVPSNIGVSHWVLFLVLVGKKQIFILDSLYSTSLGGKLEEQLKILRYFIDQSTLHCTNVPVNWSKWSVFYPSDFPRQTNCFDCGVIVCCFAYSLITGKKLRNGDFCLTVQFRKWCSNLIVDNSMAEVDTNRAPPSVSDPGPERAPQAYDDAEKAIAAGTLKVNAEWRRLPKMCIQKQCTQPTTQLIPGILGSLYKATDEFCGAPSGCKLRGTSDIMLKCQLCLEYLHMKCVSDQRQPPEKDIPYFCPIHEFGQTKTRRNINKPLRQRVSIG